MNADLLHCRFLILCPLPEFRNFEAAQRILDSRPDPNPIIDELRNSIEHARGSGKAPELLTTTNLNIPAESHVKIRMALLDLGNRDIQRWTPEDRATFEKFRKFMHGKFQFSAYDTCLLREIEAELKLAQSFEP